MTKKFWIATVAAFIFLTVCGFAIYVGVLASYLKEAMEGMGRDQALTWPYILRGVIIAMVLAFMYPKGYKGGVPWQEGLRFGLIVSILLIAYSGLDLYASFPFAGGTMIVLCIPEVIGTIITGMIIGVVYGKDTN